MKKFFLFNKERLTPSSSDSSNTGAGLGVFAISSDHLAFMTALKGAVKITFNNASLYEQSELFIGDAVKKSTVTVSCEVDKEVELIEAILGFISSPSTASRDLVMKFDVVSDRSTFPQFLPVSSSSIDSKVFKNPVVMDSGRFSQGSQEKIYQNTIAGIHFGENLPLVDYNHEGLAGYSDGDEITAWKNDGTGGVTYGITANVSDPKAEVSSSSSDINTKAAHFNLGDYFDVPAIRVNYDYTLYCVLGASTHIMALYGDDAGESLGFGGKYPASADLTENNVLKLNSSFSVRHSGMTGAVATTMSNNTDNGTAYGQFPEYQYVGNDLTKSNAEVFIIRRDVENNMYLHDRTGHIIAFIEGKGDKTMSATDPYRTDGDLLIEVLGTVKDNTSGGAGKWNGFLSRFGVIEHDIGPSRSSELARDLFDLYKTST